MKIDIDDNDTNVEQFVQIESKYNTQTLQLDQSFISFKDEYTITEQKQKTQKKIIEDELNKIDTLFKKLRTQKYYPIGTIIPMVKNIFTTDDNGKQIDQNSNTIYLINDIYYILLNGKSYNLPSSTYKDFYNLTKSTTLQSQDGQYKILRMDNTPLLDQQYNVYTFYDNSGKSWSIPYVYTFNSYDELIFHNKEGSGLNKYIINKLSTIDDTTTKKEYTDSSKIAYLTPTYKYTYRNFKVAYPQTGIKGQISSNMTAKLNVDTNGILKLTQSNACALKQENGANVCDGDECDKKDINGKKLYGEYTYNKPSVNDVVNSPTMTEKGKCIKPYDYVQGKYVHTTTLVGKYKKGQEVACDSCWTCYDPNKNYSDNDLFQMLKNSGAFPQKNLYNRELDKVIRQSTICSEHSPDYCAEWAPIVDSQGKYNCGNCKDKTIYQNKDITIDNTKTSFTQQLVKDSNNIINPMQNSTYYNYSNFIGNQSNLNTILDTVNKDIYNSITQANKNKPYYLNIRQSHTCVVYLMVVGYKEDC